MTSWNHIFLLNLFESDKLWNVEQKKKSGKKVNFICFHAIKSTNWKKNVILITIRLWYYLTSNSALFVVFNLLLILN